MTEEQPLPAGDFSSWMVEIQGAIRGERGSAVPCGGCTACCTSSQFVHIGPEESETLSHIPAELLFPAPALPPGHMLLGYDEQGHCPMLIDNQCSIYHYRPSTCRTYDCRIFAATGIGVDGDDKVLISRRVQRWQFNFPTDADRCQHDAVRAAATFLGDHPDLVTENAVVANTAERSVVAIQIHAAFLRGDDEGGQTTVVDPDAVRVEIRHRRDEGRMGNQ